MGPTKKIIKSTKGQWLTIKQKCEIIDQHERCPAVTLPQLARRAMQAFKLSNPHADATIFRTLRDAATIKKKRHSAVTPKGRLSPVRCPVLEEKLAALILSCQRQYAVLSRRLITKKAQKILASLESPPPLKLSDGWLTCFMNRHGLRFRTLHGEAASFLSLESSSMTRRTARLHAVTKLA